MDQIQEKETKFSEFKESSSWKMFSQTTLTLVVIAFACSFFEEIIKDNELTLYDLLYSIGMWLYLLPITMLSFYSISNVTTTFNYLENRDNEGFSYVFVNPILVLSLLIIIFQCIRDSVDVDVYVELIIIAGSIMLYGWSIRSMYKAECLPQISTGNFEENELQDDIESSINGER